MRRAALDAAWIWTKNKEQRGCIGCHEDGERTPENQLASALTHPAVNLMLAPERRRTVEFERDIGRCARAVRQRGMRMAALRRRNWRAKAHTRRCWHGTRKAPSSTWSRKGADQPTARGRCSAAEYVRPWDRHARAGTVRRMPPQGAAPLSEERRAHPRAGSTLARTAGRAPGKERDEDNVAGGNRGAAWWRRRNRRSPFLRTSRRNPASPSGTATATTTWTTLWREPGPASACSTTTTTGLLDIYFVTGTWTKGVSDNEGRDLRGKASEPALQKSR